VRHYILGACPKPSATAMRGASDPQAHPPERTGEGYTKSTAHCSQQEDKSGIDLESDQGQARRTPFSSGAV